MNRIFVFALAALSISIVGCNQASNSNDMQGTDMSKGSSQGISQGTSMNQTQSASATDLHNTVCPVSGEKVGNSMLTETYQGKTYHLCCKDCPAAFEKNPQKYASAVAADAAKYGVK